MIPLRRSLLAAALEAGFGSYTQFHRVYRKMFGQSPREHLSASSLGLRAPLRGADPSGM